MGDISGTVRVLLVSYNSVTTLPISGSDLAIFCDSDLNLMKSINSSNESCLASSVTSRMPLVILRAIFIKARVT